MSEEKTKRKLPYELLAEHFIAGMEKGDGMFSKPWKAGELLLPVNAVTGRSYQGANMVNLASEGRNDPRFCTLKQANEAGWRVRKGEKGRPVVYYQFSKFEAERDEEGNLVYDENGQQKLANVILQKPIISVSYIFHVSQLEGDIPAYSAMERDWNTEERAERIMVGSGVPFYHDQRDRAFYQPGKDEIHMPDRGQFPDAGSYYAVALHELCHATGHESRLNREGAGKFGSPEYAREELRAEIASFMLSMELGLDYNPDQHQAYVNNWIEVLKKDPYEIARACRDAEKIKEMVMSFERERVLEKGQEEIAAYGLLPEQENITKEVKYLVVPYPEKELAKKAGAKWDAQLKTWYAPAGTDLTPLTPWLPENIPLVHVDPQAKVTMLYSSPQEEFAKVLEQAGLDLRGELPIMDGELHRVSLKDRPHGKDAAYMGYADGRPAGYWQNFVSGEKENWKYSGQTLTEAQKETLRQESAQRRQDREQARLAAQDKVAREVSAILAERREAKTTHLYLVHKDVYPFGIKESLDGEKLLIPLCNVEGEIRSVQTIDSNGFKGFEKGGQKRGCFHAIGDMAQGEILIAEGYATGASLHQATGWPVAVCFDSGNLLAVATALRKKYPQAAVTVCADNDHHLLANPRIKKNVGLVKATEAAIAIGAKLAVPNFNAKEKKAGLTDFNDLHQARGEQAVYEAVQKGQFQNKKQGKEMAR